MSVLLVLYLSPLYISYKRRILLLIIREDRTKAFIALRSRKSLQAKGLSIVQADIACPEFLLKCLLCQTIEVEGQMEELFILSVRIEGQNGHTIIDLKEEREHGVVDNEHVGKAPVRDYAEVLYVSQSRRLGIWKCLVEGFNAVLPVEPVRNELPVWI